MGQMSWKSLEHNQMWLTRIIVLTKFLENLSNSAEELTKNPLTA